MKRMMLAAAGLVIGAWLFLLAGCGGGSSSSSSGPAPMDSAQSEVAIGVAAGATGSDDSSAGVALRTRTPLDWIADHVAFERVAYAANWSCGSGPIWGGSFTNPTFTPPNCTITYANGSMTTLTWSGGPWNLTFGGGCVPTVYTALVGSNCGSGATLLWSTGSNPIKRTWTGPLGHTYAVTTDAGSGSGTNDGWTGSPKTSSPTLVTCTSTLCPSGGSTTGTRTFSIGNGGTGASHITGTLDGSSTLHWDHTVFTTTDLTVTGSGANRVIIGGTIVVEHNLAMITLTTTFNGPLHHKAGCAFPIDGSVTTLIQHGPDDGKSETVTFTGTCGVAVLTNPDGSQHTLYLGLVL